MVRDPYARWCGRGGVARRPPIPINQAASLESQVILTIRYFLGQALISFSFDKTTKLMIHQGEAQTMIDPCRQIFLVELFLIGVVDRFNLPIGRRVVRPMLTRIPSQAMARL